MARFRQNDVCRTLTFETLPYGVCYKPRNLPLMSVGRVTVPPAFEHDAYHLTPCRLGMFETEAKYLFPMKLIFFGI